MPIEGSDDSPEEILESMGIEDPTPFDPRALRGVVLVSPDNTDAEVIEKIRFVLEGKYDKVFECEGRQSMPKRAADLGLLILDYEKDVTCKLVRSLPGYGQHAWAAKGELLRFIPVSSKRKSGQESIYEFDLEAIRRSGTVLKAGELRDLLSSKKREEIRRYHGDRCSFCPTSKMDLQVEHPIPFELGGNPKDSEPASFLVACAPCNRRKGMICKKCPNMLGAKDISVCSSCYWASPKDYDHVATNPQRYVAVVFSSEEEIAMSRQAEKLLKGGSISDFMKRNFLRLLN